VCLRTTPESNSYASIFASNNFSARVGDRTIGLIADVDAGEWAGLTFFRGDRRGAARLRSGLLVYRRE
jgi:hypothetical protein